MKIELDSQKIYLTINLNELKDYQISQLKFYGYKKSSSNRNVYVYDGCNPNIIINTYNYLLNQGINVEVSDNVYSIILQESEYKQRISSIINKAKEFKKGFVNNYDFCNFLMFADKLPRKFKEHQIKAAYHHYIVQNSADFSVPGSGKTASLLLTYEYFKIKKKVNCIFVVGPPSCFSAWKNEFKLTLGRIPKTEILSGYEKELRIQFYYDTFNVSELYLITYQSFSNDRKYIKRFFSNPAVNAFFVIDEAHYIKQLDGKWANAVLDVAKYASYRHVLTGTPCPRSYSDLFNLFDILWGYNKVISEEDKVKISVLEKNKDFVNAGGVVRSLIDPLFYRVRKSDLHLTAQQFHDPIIVKMKHYEQTVYNIIYKRISESKEIINNNINTVLALKRGRIIRLRQCLSYTKLLTTSIENYDEELEINESLSNIIINYDKLEVPGKVDALLELLLQIRKNDRKIVIWSNFIETINYLEAKIKGLGIVADHIYGDVPFINETNSMIRTREKIIEEFLSMDSNLDILIANPSACAESISLHKSCHNSIYYDLSYNCAQYLQSLDRIHRIGGSETVYSHYYFLQYLNTIDKDIFSNLLTKRDKMNQVIERDADIYNLNVDTFFDYSEDEKAYDRIFLNDDK